MNYLVIERNIFSTIIWFSGTPLQNDLKEFYAIVNLVSPGSLGSSASFSKLYEDPIVRSKQPEAKPREIEMGEEKTEELNHLTSQVSISSLFYKQLLCTQILKAQNRQSSCQSFCAFGICPCKTCS
jgi:hypothetical protein